MAARFLLPPARCAPFSKATPSLRREMSQPIWQRHRWRLDLKFGDLLLDKKATELCNPSSWTSEHPAVFLRRTENDCSFVPTSHPYSFTLRGTRFLTISSNPVAERQGWRHSPPFFFLFFLSSGFFFLPICFLHFVSAFELSCLNKQTGAAEDLAAFAFSFQFFFFFFFQATKQLQHLDLAAFPNRKQGFEILKGILPITGIYLRSVNFSETLPSSRSCLNEFASQAQECFSATAAVGWICSRHQPMQLPPPSFVSPPPHSY